MTQHDSGTWALEHDAKQAFIARAKSVLDDNWTGHFTIPSPSLYPHQWSWDSGFITLAYARYDTDRAVEEMRHLFAAQWSNGMLPQIVFNPEAGRDYFPGPDHWDAARSPHAPPGIRTTGIIQPPVHATAMWHIYRDAKDKTKALHALEEAYPSLVAWHQFLRRDRMPDGDGLACILHPWESGQDNSPIWDRVRQRTELPPEAFRIVGRHKSDYIHKKTRPTSRDYAFYLHLVELFKEVDYEPRRMRERSPFVIEDVLFNTLMCRSLLDLAKIAHLLDEDPVPWQAAAHQTQVRMNHKLWNERLDTYLDHDRNTRRQIQAEVAAGFTPLYAFIPTADRAQRMVAALDSPKFCRVDEHSWAIPSYDRQSRKFSKSRYWRGPVWTNINWVLCHGLRLYGYHDHADLVRRAVIRLPHQYGFREYFDPESGEGLGSDRFSWTAALALELLLDPMDHDQPTAGNGRADGGIQHTPHMQGKDMQGKAP